MVDRGESRTRRVGQLTDHSHVTLIFADPQGMEEKRYSKFELLFPFIAVSQSCGDLSARSLYLAESECSLLTLHGTTDLRWTEPWSFANILGQSTLRFFERLFNTPYEVIMGFIHVQDLVVSV